MLPLIVQTGLNQFLRYVTVGLLNTSIDLIITNLLISFTLASAEKSLLLISFFASVFATINSYYWNRRWTYGVDAQALPRYAFARFFGIALIAMIANTSVFLFTYQTLMAHWQLSRLLAVNLAKIFGIVTGCLVGFFGYRVGVFELASMRQFRASFQFDVKRACYSWWQQTAVLLFGAVLVRMLYLTLTTAITGGAVHYAQTAEQLSLGQFLQVDLFWNNPFSYWEALFRVIGLGPVHAAIAASFVPGVWLLLPVVALARFLYGEMVAWLAGWMTVFHPRLVEYSCNGFPDSFVLLVSIGAVTLLTLSLSTCRKETWLYGAGCLFGLYFCTLPYALASILICALVGWWRRSLASVFAARSWRYVIVLLCGFCSSLFFYLGLLELTTTGTTAQTLEFFHPFLGEDQHSDPISTNVVWTMSVIPGLLLSPLWFFAVLLPLFYRFRADRGPGESLLLTVGGYPLFMVMFLKFETKLLLPLLVPIHIFGAAALFAFSEYLRLHFQVKKLEKWFLTPLMVFFLALVAWRGVDTERQYAPYRVVADWLKQNVPVGEVLAGDGFGFVSTTGFLAGRPTVSRFWDVDTASLMEFLLRSDSNWLVLYESYLGKVNPELLPALDKGLPGMQLVYQTYDQQNHRIQVYRANRGRFQP